MKFNSRSYVTQSREFGYSCSFLFMYGNSAITKQKWKKAAGKEIIEKIS